MENEAPGTDTMRENCTDVEVLQEQLKEKDDIISAYETKLKNLYEDFNYNVQLIYDRDKEIDGLNAKIDELIAINREKEIEIISLRSVYSKVRQLEQDKVILSKRIDTMLSSANCPKPQIRKANTPKPEDVNNSAEFRGPLHKKFLSVDKSTKIISSAVPLSKLNIDLEKRIKALEHENESKRDRLSFKSFTNELAQDMDSDSTDKVLSKEKEISDLIKSLSPYKREVGRGKKLAPYESSSNSLARDYEKIRVEPVRPSSRIFDTEPAELRRDPAFRYGHSSDKRPS